MKWPDTKKTSDIGYGFRAIRPFLVALAASLSLLAACQTPAPVIHEQMTPLEFFQAAREASALHHHTVAMTFYETYLKRFPATDHPQEAKRNLWAEYEIAFLHYKQGDDETAIALLNQLIAKYESTSNTALPQAPIKLARRVIEELNSNANSTGAKGALPD